MSAAPARPPRRLRGLGRALLVPMLVAALHASAWDDERMAAAAQRLGPRAVGELQGLRPALVQASELAEADRLHYVNDFFNRRIRFRDDLPVWGQVDYWASPLEALSKGEGDCEDYAIAKYFTLVAAGTPVERLRLVYVRAQLRGQPGPQAHMVLAYYGTPDAEPLILDNLVGEVRPAARRPDLVPVFSFNGEGLWQGVGSQSAGDPVARLSRWREVLAKARAEGF
ncbi:transglutaminase-like cysteine peptidase [Aquincola agrisoli]|uniref:transglutaminase-like cysteine peptidase n=1 Tax=Aquincola TaxID=391952 RepID=UPI002FBEC180